MTREQELWACALAIEREYGDGAILHAAMEIDRLNAEGAREAARMWWEVLKRIDRLRAGHGPAQ
jgi:hypothetical protein